MCCRLDHNSQTLLLPTICILLNSTEFGIKFDERNDASVRSRETVQLMKYDCARRTSVVLSAISYDAQGRVRTSEAQADYDFNYRPVAPDSVNESAMNIACNPVDEPRDLWEEIKAAEAGKKN